MSDTWSPLTYLQFNDERTRAARDLLAQVALQSARSVVDVGCGPGNSTALLLARFPNAEMLGIALSPRRRGSTSGTRSTTTSSTVRTPSSTGCAAPAFARSSTRCRLTNGRRS
jgi:trans-aconitate methyltransferase